MKISKETLDELKTNLAQYSEMPDSLKTVMSEIGRNEFMFLDRDGMWVKPTFPHYNYYVSYCIFRLREDYDPKEVDGE